MVELAAICIVVAVGVPLACFVAVMALSVIGGLLRIACEMVGGCFVALSLPFTFLYSFVAKLIASRRSRKSPKS